jgi:hypothetical protein
MLGSAPYLHSWYDERKDNMEWDLIMSVRVTEEMLKGTTFEEIAETIKDSAEKSGYTVYDSFYEEACEDG